MEVVTTLIGSRSNDGNLAVLGALLEEVMQAETQAAGSVSSSRTKGGFTFTFHH